MYRIATNRSRQAFREALQALRDAWALLLLSAEPPEAPREAQRAEKRAEALALRQRLGRSKNLRQALKAAREVAPSTPKAGVEIALLWERCRVRAAIAEAIVVSDTAGLVRALAAARRLGLAVHCEEDLCRELEDREVFPRLGRSSVNWEALDTEDEEEEVHGARAGAASAEAVAAAAPRPRAKKKAKAKARSTRRVGWWSRLLYGTPLREESTSPTAPARQGGELLGAQWRGPRDDLLLQAARDHLNKAEGPAPVPHELAIDLGLLPLTPSPSLGPAAARRGSGGGAGARRNSAVASRRGLWQGAASQAHTSAPSKASPLRHAESTL